MRWLILTIALALCGPAVAQTAPTTAGADHPLKPNLRCPDLLSYEKTIGEAGVLLKSDHLWLFAPKRKTAAANTIFRSLVRAYDELYRIVGAHTEYKIVVYHLPDGYGETHVCEIDYDYSNLDLEKQEEWTRYKVPHVSGYIEEMAHNFVSGTHAQFGWEMIGWSIGAKVSQKVAPNPKFMAMLTATHKEQADTFARYKAGGFIFPDDLKPNLCDRIHAHLLNQCEKKYGPNFWRDFFAEVRARQRELDDAVHQKGDDGIRNERYRITVECFDKLPRLNFRQMLEQNGISTTVDVKSLHPMDPGWSRRLR